MHIPMKYGFLPLVLAGGFVCSAMAQAQEPPQVVVTIQPVHSLVSAVMEGIATPELLIEGGGSPHSYSLRPSKARAVEEADAVFWVGEAMETFMVRPLAALNADARLVTLSELEGIQLLENRSGGTWEGHAGAHGDDHRHEHDDSTHHQDPHSDGQGHEGEDDHHQEEDDHHHDHVHGSFNMHIWLSPDNARAMLTGIRDVLTDLDPAHSADYRANTQHALERLDTLETELQQQLAGVSARPYIVFHDAYRYFEEAFGLNAVGSVTLSPERQPGVRRMTELREKLEQLEAVCIFSEPQFEPRLVSSLVEGTGVETGELDPLGAALEPGPDAYFELMRQLGDELEGCLTRAN